MKHCKKQLHITDYHLFFEIKTGLGIWNRGRPDEGQEQEGSYPFPPHVFQNVLNKNKKIKKSKNSIFTLPCGAPKGLHKIF